MVYILLNDSHWDYHQAWAGTVSVRVKSSGAFQIRPTIAACIECWRWWKQFVFPLMTWSVYCQKCAGPEFSHVMSVAAKVTQKQAALTYEPETVHSGTESRDLYRRIKVVIPETEVKTLLKKQYLNKETLKGVEQRMVPTEKDPDTYEMAMVFYSDEYPHRLLMEDFVTGEARRCSHMTQDAHVWPDKAKEMASHFRNKRALVDGPPRQTILLSEFLAREGVSQSQGRPVVGKAGRTRSRSSTGTINNKNINK